MEATTAGATWSKNWSGRGRANLAERGDRSRQGPRSEPRPIASTPHLRDLLVMDRLPESWSRTRPGDQDASEDAPLHDEERTAHSSASTLSSFTTAILRSATSRRRQTLASGEAGASRSGPEGVDFAAMIEHINEELEPIEAELKAYAAHRPVAGR